MLEKKMTEEELSLSWVELEPVEGDPATSWPADGSTVQVRFGGILKEAGDLLDCSVMIPLREASKMQRIQGNTGNPRDCSLRWNIFRMPKSHSRTAENGNSV